MTQTISLFHRDALSYLKDIPDNFFDLVLTDPPYVISRDSGFSSMGENSVERFAVSIDFGEWDKRGKDEHEALLKEVFKEYFRVLRKGGTVICWYDLWKLQSLTETATEAGFKQPRLIEWLKTNPVPLNSSRNYLTNSREVALSVVKGGKPTFNSSYDNGVYEFPIHRDGGKRLHPTQKPLKLSEELIRKHSNPGDKILDTFAGSGTHLIAAKNCDRQAYGCEIDGKYYEAACNRILEVCDAQSTKRSPKADRGGDVTAASH